MIIGSGANFAARNSTAAIRMRQSIFFCFFVIKMTSLKGENLNFA